MFDKFPPPIRATIEAFFKERPLAATADDYALDLATELELQHLDLSVGDAERIAVKQSPNCRLPYVTHVKAVSSSAMANAYEEGRSRGWRASSHIRPWWRST